VIVYDHNYLWSLIESRKIPKPFKKMKKRLFKKLIFYHWYLPSDLFVLATKEQIGAMYYEHGKNHVVTGFFTPGRWVSRKRKSKCRIYVPSSGIKNETPGDYFCSCAYAEYPKSKNEIESYFVVNSIVNSQSWEYFDNLSITDPTYRTKSEIESFKSESKYLLESKFDDYRAFHKTCLESYFDIQKGFNYSDDVGVLRKEFADEELRLWRLTA
jgi:hypothetical protein